MTDSPPYPKPGSEKGANNISALEFLPFMAFGVEHFPLVLRHCAEQAEKLLMAQAQEEHDDGG